MIDTETLAQSLTDDGLDFRDPQTSGGRASVTFRHAASGTDCVATVEGLTTEEAASAFKMRYATWVAAREAELV